MIKKYLNFALVYAIAAMVFGVFYREFTKPFNLTGQTSLSVMHTHYFILGMVFFLIFALLEKSFDVTAQKGTPGLVLGYNLGLNITGAGLFVRGLTQVWDVKLSAGMDAALSGVAGAGHIILGLCIILLLLQVRKRVQE